MSYAGRGLEGGLEGGWRTAERGGSLRAMLAGAPCGYVASSALSGSLVVGTGPGVLRGVGGSI